MVASKKDLAAQLRQLLARAEQRGRLKRAALARTVGVSPSSLYAYLDGTTLPPPDVLTRLLDVLNVPGTQQERLTAARDALDPRTAAAPGGVPHPFQLPHDVVGFTGRSGEVARLDDLTTTGVVAIDGTAGVGKTALAVHWAHRARDRFPDGQLYLNMRGYDPLSPPLSAAEALTRLLQALGVDRTPADVEIAASVYRSLVADKRVLLVLDNVASADQVRPLLPGGRGSAVVVTSRDQLGGLVARDGAHRLHLDVLPPDDARALLVEVLAPVLAGTDDAAVAELAGLCAWLPLALRIAAANMMSRPYRHIGDYVAHLRARNPVAALAVAGDPHSAVAVSLGLSYRRLSPSARRMFRMFGLVPGPDVTAEAAAALLDVDTTRADGLLAELASTHLVEEPAVGRYTCHDLLRQYAADIAARDEPDQDAARDRLYDHYLHTAYAAARVLRPRPLLNAGEADDAPDHDQALRWLDAELPNLVAVAVDAGRHGARSTAWLLADALRGYFWRRRTLSDWFAVSEAAVAAAHTAGDVIAEAAAWLCLADANQAGGDYPTALECYERVDRLSRDLDALVLGHNLTTGESEIQYVALNNAAEILRRLGLLNDAADRYRQILDYDRWVQNRFGEALQLGNLGSVLAAMGQLRQAADLHDQATTLLRQHGGPNAAAADLHQLGHLRHLLGDDRTAQPLLTEALSLHRLAGERAGEAETLLYLAALHRDRGEPALDLARAALARARDIGDSHVEANALNCLGTIHHRLGQHQEAVEHHEQARRKAGDAELRYAEAEALLGLATTGHDDAEELLRQATAIIETAGFTLLRGQALTVLAQHLLAAGDLAGATKAAEHALDIHRETGYRLGEAHALTMLGQASDDRTAHEHRTRARAILAETGQELFTAPGSGEQTNA